MDGEGAQSMNRERYFQHIEEQATTLSRSLLPYREDPHSVLMSLLQSGLGLSSILSGMLHLPRHIFIAENLRAPCACPCSIGALTETNFIYMEESVIARQPWPYRELRAYIEREIQEQRRNIARLKETHRSPHGLPNLVGRNVLLVNDGTASITLLIASIESFRSLGAGRIVLAVPSDSKNLGSDLEHRAGELVDELVVGSARRTLERKSESTSSLAHPWVA
jgi:putative phosphoribosyl transferase